MNWVDYCVLGILAVSMLVGVLRGFIREALNLSSWILAVIAALVLAPPLERWLAGLIALDPARLIIAYLSVFILALIVGSVVTHFVANAIRRTPFSGVDRVLGGGFGTARGVLVIVLLMAAAGLTVLDREPWWQEARLLPWFEPMAEWVQEQLPEGWIEDIKPQSEPAAARVVE
jgi:membrane protein required for colicin V production